MHLSAMFISKYYFYNIRYKATYVSTTDKWINMRCVMGGAPKMMRSKTAGLPTPTNASKMKTVFKQLHNINWKLAEDQTLKVKISPLSRAKEEMKKSL